mgnify:CR=1 FL=1
MKSAVKPTNIKQFSILYEDGTKVVIDEQDPPIVGKLYYDAINKKNVEWRIIESNKPSLLQKLLKSISI